MDLDPVVTPGLFRVVMEKDRVRVLEGRDLLTGALGPGGS